jgi:hypothetical protein
MTKSVIGKPKARSKVSNGTSLLQDADNRTTWVRRARDVLASHIADLGGASECSEAEKAVEAAEKHDDEIADAALRQVGAELQMPLVQRRDLAPGHLQILAYYQRAAKRAPPPPQARALRLV